VERDATPEGRHRPDCPGFEGTGGEVEDHATVATGVRQAVDDKKKAEMGRDP